MRTPCTWADGSLVWSDSAGRDERQVRRLSSPHGFALWAANTAGGTCRSTLRKGEIKQVSEGGEGDGRAEKYNVTEGQTLRKT